VARHSTVTRATVRGGLEHGRLVLEITDEGLRAAVAIRARRPELPVLVLSQYVEQTYAAELLDSGDDDDTAGGGVGYLLKDRVGDVEEFVDAVQRVAAGHTVVDPYLVRQSRARLPPRPLNRCPPATAAGVRS
jgi:DNA-binding NarL/FixJ family response regulator